MKAGRFLRARLRAKVLALVIGILVVGFGLLVGLNLGRERRALEARHRETARFLAACVRARQTIVFAGPPGSGKTTLLSCCAAELDPGLRVVIAEEVFEADVPLANVASLHEIGHEVTKSSWALPVTSRQDMNANQASNVNGVSCRDHCMGAPKPSSGYMVASSRFNNQ